MGALTLILCFTSVSLQVSSSELRGSGYVYTYNQLRRQATPRRSSSNSIASVWITSTAPPRLRNQVVSSGKVYEENGPQKLVDFLAYPCQNGHVSTNILGAILCLAIRGLYRGVYIVCRYAVLLFTADASHHSWPGGIQYTSAFSAFYAVLWGFIHASRPEQASRRTRQKAYTQKTGPCSASGLQDRICELIALTGCERVRVRPSDWPYSPLWARVAAESGERSPILPHLRCESRIGLVLASFLYMIAFASP